MAKKIVKTQPDMTLEEAGYDYKSLAGEIGQAARDTQTYLKEASAAVEQWLSIEDRGWLIYGNPTNNSLDLIPNLRQYFVYRSRRYFAMDPMARQAIRLWTDYTFGNGISFQCKDEKAKTVLDAFWNSQDNRAVMSFRGQRKSGEKLLIDGEIFFAFFRGPGGAVKIRWIDPLEIREIITDPGDVVSQKFFNRQWMDQLAVSHDEIYKAWTNDENEEAVNSAHQTVQCTPGLEDVLVYHLPFNSIGQRGMPLLMPVMDWIDEYRRFLASRIAIVRALGRFAWKNKVMGGTSSVAAAKATQQGKYPQGGSTYIENMGADLEPIKTDTGASNAEADGRMIKLMIAAGVGIPEHYFGDVSMGGMNATKTVELPLVRMFEGNQQLWSDAYEDILGIVLNHNDIDPSTVNVDLDFPMIVPQDSTAIVTAITQVVGVMPDLAKSDEVIMQALMNLGINNTADVMEWMKNQGLGSGVKAVPPQKGVAESKTMKALKMLREAIIEEQGKGNAVSKM